MKLLHRLRRHRLSYELLSCALQGHELVGTNVKTIRPQDSLLVREYEGLRWHRCLRCDVWVPREVPRRPLQKYVPDRATIDVPIRGKLLRDRYVLRLIAVDRAIHVLILSIVALAIFLFASHQEGLKSVYQQLLLAFQGVNGGVTFSNELGKIQGLFSFSPFHIYEVGALVVAFACLEAIEMIGLWRGKRWAEYLTFIATIVFIPYEIYELIHGVTILKAAAFIINVAIAIYLLYAKRLFGINGGIKGENAEKARDSGWGALERTTPK